MSGVKERLQKDSEVFLKPSGSHSSRPIEVRDPTKLACYAARQATASTIRAKNIHENLQKIQQATEGDPSDDVTARLQQKYHDQIEKKRKRKEFGTGPTSGGLARRVQNVAHQYQNQQKDRNMVVRGRRISAEEQMNYADDSNKEQGQKRKRSSSEGKSRQSKKSKKEEKKASSPDKTKKSASGKNDKSSRRSSSRDQREHSKVKELETKYKTLREENKVLKNNLNVRLEAENDVLRLYIENQAAADTVQREMRRPQPSPEKLKRQNLLQNLRNKRLSKGRQHLSHSDSESEEETAVAAQPESEDDDLDCDVESVADDTRSVVSEYEEAPIMDTDPEPPMFLAEVNSPRAPPPASPAPSAFSVELKPVNLPENLRSSRIPNIIDDTQYDTIAGNLESLMCSQAAEPAADVVQNAPTIPTTINKPPVVVDLLDSEDEEQSDPRPPRVPNEPRLAMERGFLKFKMELYELIYKSKLIAEYVRPVILQVDADLEDADDYTRIRLAKLEEFLNDCHHQLSA